MQKTFLVATREFRQQIKSRGFWLTGIGVPVVMLLIWVFTGGLTGSAAPESTADSETADLPEQPIGYVDQANLIRFVPDSIPADLFQAFADALAAESALEQGDITAYYLIQPDYRETGHAQRISLRPAVNPADVRWFNRLLVSNFLPEADEAFIDRLRQPFYQSGLQFSKVNASGQTEAAGNQMLPFVVSLAIMLPLLTGGTYLFHSLIQEKSNRVMEILLVSLRPQQLLLGKILGLSALILVQYLLWGGIGLVVLTVTGPGESLLLTGLNLTGVELILIISFALGGFLLYAALMAGVGALARSVEDSRVWLFVISLPMMIPIYLWVAIVDAPDGLLAVALSLFPFSAPIAMLMRLTNAAVPAWQITISLGLLLLSGVGIIWLMARLFRARTLLSGESLSLRRFWAALQS